MKKLKQFFFNSFTTATMLLAPRIAWATDGAGTGGGALAGTKLVTGFQKLMDDATGAVIALAIPITVFCVVACLVMRSASDEQNQKKWGDRAKTALVCGIGAIVVGGLIKVIVGYFQ